jgi:hypothetical protein
MNIYLSKDKFKIFNNIKYILFILPSDLTSNPNRGAILQKIKNLIH